MRVESIACAALMLLSSVSGGEAQPHPGAVLVGDRFGQGGALLAGLYRVDKTKTTSFYTSYFPKYTPPNPAIDGEVEMGLDNRSIVFGASSVPGPGYHIQHGLYTYDPQTSTYTTLASNAVDMEIVHGVEVNQDGNWHVLAEWRDQRLKPHYRIYEVRRDASGYSTVLTTVGFGATRGMYDPLRRDVDTGDLLVSARSTTRPTRLVYALDPNGSLSTWHASHYGFSPGFPAYGFTQDIRSGDLLHMDGLVSYTTSPSLFRTSKGTMPIQSTPTGIPPTLAAATGIVLENQSSPQTTAIAYAWLSTQLATDAALTFFDPSIGTVTRTLWFVRTPTLTPLPNPFASIRHEGNRYIQTVRTAARTWELRFAFPALAGKAYVAVAGVSGVRPGFRLADGRRVWLNMDSLFTLTLGNRLRPVFDSGPLTLDARGAAKGKLDLSALPPNLGIPIHVVVAVLDPAAPLGVAFVTEPYPFKL